VVAWGRATAYEADYLFDPYGCGWHLDRARFDQMLLGAALDAGVDVQVAPDVECHRVGTGPTERWAVRAAGRSLGARWLIDASGRASCVARRQGVERARLDRLIGLARFFTAPPDADPRTVIEAGELGWWYYATLPKGRAVAVLFTDADLLPRSLTQRERRWTELAGRTQLIAGCLDSTSGGSRLVAAAACSGALARPCGQRWLAVGDAAQSWDPLSGQGITKALNSAMAAVEVLGPDGSFGSAPDHYADRVAADYRDYLRVRSAYYGRETRWARSPFWRRRITA
jgi:flavin-dependent dehydrogenase